MSHAQTNDKSIQAVRANPRFLIFALCAGSYFLGLMTSFVVYRKQVAAIYDSSGNRLFEANVAANLARDVALSKHLDAGNVNTVRNVLQISIASSIACLDRRISAESSPGWVVKALSDGKEFYLKPKPVSDANGSAANMAENHSIDLDGHGTLRAPGHD